MNEEVNAVYLTLYGVGAMGQKFGVYKEFLVGSPCIFPFFFMDYALRGGFARLVRERLSRFPGPVTPTVRRPFRNLAPEFGQRFAGPQSVMPGFGYGRFNERNGVRFKRFKRRRRGVFRKTKRRFGRYRKGAAGGRVRGWRSRFRKRFGRGFKFRRLSRQVSRLRQRTKLMRLPRFHVDGYLDHFISWFATMTANGAPDTAAFHVTSGMLPKDIDGMLNKARANMGRFMPLPGSTWDNSWLRVWVSKFTSQFEVVNQSNNRVEIDVWKLYPRRDQPAVAKDQANNSFNPIVDGNLTYDTAAASGGNNVDANWLYTGVVQSYGGGGFAGGPNTNTTGMPTTPPYTLTPYRSWTCCKLFRIKKWKKFILEPGAQTKFFHTSFIKKRFSFEDVGYYSASSTTTEIAFQNAYAWMKDLGCLYLWRARGGIVHDETIANTAQVVLNGVDANVGTIDNAAMKHGHGGFQVGVRQLKSWHFQYDFGAIPGKVFGLNNFGVTESGTAIPAFTNAAQGWNPIAPVDAGLVV